MLTQITLEQWLRNDSESLPNFLWKTAHGCRVLSPPDYRIEDTAFLDDFGKPVKIVHHLGTRGGSVGSFDGVKVLFPPLLPTADHPVWLNDPVLVYHYTDKDQFACICNHQNRKATLLAEKMLNDPDDTSFGDGSYCTLKGPQEFGSKEKLLINNCTNIPCGNNMLEHVQPHVNKADYCVPLIVQRSIVKIVTEEATHAVKNAGYGPGETCLGHKVREGRDVCVVVMKVGDVGTSDARSRKEILEQTLIDATESGNVEAIASLLDDPDHSLRRRAVEAIAKSAPHGDSQAVELLGQCLEDEHWAVRRSAVQAIMKVASEDDSKTKELIVRRVEDKEWVVRVAAVRAIAKVAFISHHLDDSDWYVRQAVVETMAEVAKKGDTVILDLFVQRFEDKEGRVREAAVRAIAKVMSGSKPDGPKAKGAMTMITPQLEDADSGVRAAAVEAVSKLASRGDGKAMERIAQCLGDAEKPVRDAAVEGYAKVAQGSAKAMDIIGQHLGDADSGVRVSALEAISKVAPRGDAKAMELVTYPLGDAEAAVRGAALKAIAGVALQIDQNAIYRIAQHMEDPDSGVRVSAIDAICKMLPQGDPRAMELVYLRLQDPEEIVREAAQQAIAKATPEALGDAAF